MKFLLPHQFKLIGAIMAPLGLFIWLGWQLGYLSILGGSEMRSLKVGVLVASIFSFLFGLYFVVFSREKLEDEMIQRIRLESFLLASWMQIVLLILFFTLFTLFGEPFREIGMLLCFIGLIVLFWISYIVSFNYTLHFRNKEWKTK